MIYHLFLFFFLTYFLIKERDLPMKGSPAQILANQEYFDQLSDLFDCGDQLSEKVWELLNLLPISQKLTKELESLDKKLEDLFHSKSTFKLLYSLEALLFVANSDSISPNKDWSKKF